MPLLVLGAGGHAKVLLSLLRLRADEVLGLIDANPALAGKQVHGHTVLGDESVLGSYDPAHTLLVNGLGSTASTQRRRELFERCNTLGFRFSSAIHPSAIVADDVTLGEGVQIMAGAVVQTGASLGANSIINTRASIDHDCDVGAHVHVAPGVTLSGTVRVGSGAHIGTGAVVIQGIEIGEYALVAAGSVVIRDVAPRTAVLGVPARLKS